MYKLDGADLALDYFGSHGSFGDKHVMQPRSAAPSPFLPGPFTSEEDCWSG
jgi:hypothetical protein